MCLRRFRVKSVSPAGITSVYAPCGVCEDCRRKLSSAWSFRINAEFLRLKKLGFNVAFCTLTYNNRHLPHIPEECFKSDYKLIPCFDRAQVRDWIDSIRQLCKYRFGFKFDSRIRYFIASELGTLRHRPHYHVLLAWPSSVSYELMHSICTANWTYGFLFPRRPEGDGKCLSFEVVGDPCKVFSYVSKYACKDLTLHSLQSDSSFYDDVRHYEEFSDEWYRYKIWKNCQSFHIQSQSLGLEAIKYLSDDKKLEIYRYGMQFSADDKPIQVPIYIKNKLLFDPYYVYEDGKRLVRKKANDFFLAHVPEIFKMKSQFYQKYCSMSESVEYYVKRGLKAEDVVDSVKKLQYCRSKAEEFFTDLDNDNKLGKMYLAFHRVPIEYCYDIPPMSQYLLRYSPEARLVACHSITRGAFIDGLLYLRDYWEVIDSLNAQLGSFGLPERTEDARKVTKCQDFFKNILKGV